MKTKTFLLLSALLLGFLCSSCSLLEFARDSREAGEATAALGGAVGGEVGLTLKLIAGIMSGVSGIAFGLHKWRVAMQLKKAIRGRASSIDKAKFCLDEGIAEAAQKTMAYVKAIETASNPHGKENGEVFDAVRKGLF